MKTFFRKAMGKKLFTTLLVLFMATFAAFAVSITVEGEVGDAKIYDNNYKLVANPTEASTGYVVKTAETIIKLANDTLVIEIEPGSLVQLMSLGGTPEIYILDGRAVVASTKAFRVRTTVTYYTAEANSQLYIVTEDAEESAFVTTGSATVTDLIIGKKSDVPEGVYTNLIPAEEVVEEPVVEEAVVEETVTEEPVVEEAVVEEPVVEEAVIEEPAVEEPVAEEPVVIAPLSRTLTYAGYSATVTAYVGQATVEYPAFVTNEEINAAAAAASWKYPEDVKGITYEFTEPGVLTVYYPETYGELEFNYAMDILEKELPAYISELMAKAVVEEPVVEEPVVEEPVAEEPVAVEETAEEVLGPLSHTFTYGPFSATLDAYIGTAFLTYPDFVRDDEIDAAAYAASMAYPEDVKGIYYEITEPGKATITYPENYGKLEFDYAVALIEKELPGYIASLFPAQPEPQPEPEAVVAEEPAPEAPVEPAPVEPAPVEPAPEEPVKTPIETTPRPEPQVVEPEEKKESSFRFGATIGVIYGLDHPSSSYKAFLNDRIGGFGKNLEVYVDPTIYYNNLTFGLHFVVDMSLFNPTKIVNPFTFSTNGITDIVNSVMSYVSVFSIDGEKFDINVDRKSELEFRSPIYSDLKRAYDTEEKLIGTASFTAGSFSAYAFVDDLQFQSKLEGRGQYAGLRAAFKLGKVEVGASAIVDVRNGLKSMNFYPAADIVIPFTFQNTTIEIDAGFAAQLTTDSVKGMLVEGKINVTAGVLTIGAGAAYNKGQHFNDIVNNGPADVITQFSGDSIDILLSGEINTKHLRISGSVDAPFALDGGSRLAYNTVKTKSGDTALISADTLNAQADLVLGKFTFSAGAVYNGFCGRLANLLKAIKNASGRRAALAGFVDPEISTYYGIADLKLGTFDAYVRADLTRVNGTMTIPVSVGASFSF